MDDEKKFLMWIYERLINVHGENPNMDYMLKLKELIEAVKR